MKVYGLVYHEDRYRSGTRPLLAVGEADHKQLQVVCDQLNKCAVPDGYFEILTFELKTEIPRAEDLLTRAVSWH